MGDNGTQLVSSETFLRRVNVSYKATPLYSLHCNVAVERLNLTIKNLLQANVLEGSTWQDASASVLQLYRSIYHNGFQMSPFRIDAWT